MRPKVTWVARSHEFDQEHKGVRDEHEEWQRTRRMHATQPDTIRFTPDSPNHYPDRISRGKDTRLNPREKHWYTIYGVTRVRDQW